VRATGILDWTSERAPDEVDKEPPRELTRLRWEIVNERSGATEDRGTVQLVKGILPIINGDVPTERQNHSSPEGVRTLTISP
jgi:hypothetical protein